MLSLLRMAAEMLLPEGTTRKLCDMALGLMVMLTMLRVLRRFLSGWPG